MSHDQVQLDIVERLGLIQSDPHNQSVLQNRVPPNFVQRTVFQLSAERLREVPTSQRLNTGVDLGLENLDQRVGVVRNTDVRLEQTLEEVGDGVQVPGDHFLPLVQRTRIARRHSVAIEHSTTLKILSYTPDPFLRHAVEFRAVEQVHGPRQLVEAIDRDVRQVLMRHDTARQGRERCIEVETVEG